MSNPSTTSGTKYYIFRVNADENVNVDSQLGQSILGDGTTPENIQTTGGVANFQFDPNMTTEVFAHIMNSQRAIETIRAARSITRDFIIEKGRLLNKPDATNEERNAAGNWIHRAWTGFFAAFNCMNVSAASWEKLRKVFEFNWISEHTNNPSATPTGGRPGCFFTSPELRSRAGILRRGDAKCTFACFGMMGSERGAWRSLMWKGTTTRRLQGNRTNVYSMRFGADHFFKSRNWPQYPYNDKYNNYITGIYRRNRNNPEVFEYAMDEYADERMWDFAGNEYQPISPVGDFHPIFFNRNNEVTLCLTQPRTTFVRGNFVLEEGSNTYNDIRHYFSGGPSAQEHDIRRFFSTDAKITFPQIDEEDIFGITSGAVSFRKNERLDTVTAYYFIPIIWYYDLLFSPIPGLTLDGSNDDIYSPESIAQAARGTKFLSLAEYVERKGPEKIVMEIRRDCLRMNRRLATVFGWTSRQIVDRYFDGSMERMKAELEIWQAPNTAVQVTGALRNALNNPALTSTTAGAITAVVAGAANIIAMIVDRNEKKQREAALKYYWYRDVFGIACPTQDDSAFMNAKSDTDEIKRIITNPSTFAPTLRTFQCPNRESYDQAGFEDTLLRTPEPSVILEPYEDGTDKKRPVFTFTPLSTGIAGQAELLERSAESSATIVLDRKPGSEAVVVTINDRVVNGLRIEVPTRIQPRVRLIASGRIFRESELEGGPLRPDEERTLVINPPPALTQDILETSVPIVRKNNSTKYVLGVIAVLGAAYIATEFMGDDKPSKRKDTTELKTVENRGRRRK
jgi:hypothetical protein